MLTTTYSGIADAPELTSTIRLYDDLPFGDIEVKVQNSTKKPVTVQMLRSVEAIGSPSVNLGGRESTTRVLSDTFTVNELKIYDLAEAPKRTHLAVGSQLIYNRDSGQSLFFGALSSRRFPVVFDLRADGASSDDAKVISFTADSTSVSEMAKREEERAGEPLSTNLVELNLFVAPGEELAAERLMFAVGSNYHTQLETYGHAIRDLYHARVDSGPMMGWWSWTSYYVGISEGTAVTNAHWLAEHLTNLGYNYFFIDEGYQYARGEYATPDAVQFPHGMLPVGHEVSRLGLKFGVWTAPFQVSERAWVYQNHKDWLVHDAKGAPVHTSNSPEPMYVLDATHPGAQDYLRKTFQTLTREWSVHFIKLDFMDESAVEGYFYRPNTTAYEVQRIGLEVIRSAVGEDVLLDKDGAPMILPVGVVDVGRISEDTAHIFSAAKRTALGIAGRYFMNRNFFVSDPDAFVISPLLVTPDQARNQTETPLTSDEAQVSIVTAAVSSTMFEIGDDLPTLAAYPDRLAWVENLDLIHMSQLGRASTPIDLMSYRKEDIQPSVFLLREDKRQTMLAVFNFSDAPNSHSFRWSDLDLPAGHYFELLDVLNQENPVSASEQSIEFPDQAPHSVRLIKIVDTTIPAAPPTLTLSAPTSGETAKIIALSVSCAPDGVPALSYHWDFGDGTTDKGSHVTHTYTRAGTYPVKVSAEGVDGIPANQTASLSVTGVVDTRFKLKQNQRYVDPTDR
jgi:hypothetical protein